MNVQTLIEELQKHRTDQEVYLVQKGSESERYTRIYDIEFVTPLVSDGGPSVLGIVVDFKEDSHMIEMD